MPAEEVRGGLTVRRPRYLHVPGVPRFNARSFAMAAERALRPFEDDRERCDVVVADYAWPAAMCRAWAQAEGRAFVVSGRGSDVLEVEQHRRLAPLLAAALARADARIAVSLDLAAAMDRLAGRGRTELVPNGVDSDLFRPRPRPTARAQLAQGELALLRGGTLPEHVPIALVVGHLIPRKDPLLALEVFARGAPADAWLVFIGRGALAADVEARAAALGLGDRVHVLAPADAAALSVWYAAADVLLLTSSREGRPNVVLEALSSGCPVLATDAGGTGELLAQLPECLVHSRDPGVIGAQLTRLLKSPPSAERCRAAVAGLTWERSAATLEGVLEGALARRRGSR